MHVNLIAGGNKIIIKNGKITLNGKEYEVLINALKGTPKLIEDTAAMTPVITNAGGSYHQAFIFGENKNFMLILSHSKKLELANKETAMGKKIFTQYKEQNFYFSFIDYKNTDIMLGHKIGVFGKNGLYDFGQYAGFTLRSAICKHS